MGSKVYTNRKVYTNAFSGGEISPLMFGHIEDEGYRSGFARGRNMLVLPTGAAQKRPQFDFVRKCKTGASPVRLFPFVYGDGDAYAMEWGTNHVRFHADGTTLLYATPRPVASVDLSADTFTTVAAHSFSVDDEVRITHKGTSIPGNLSTGTTYKIETVPSSTTFSLKDSGGSHIDLTTNSTIDETSFWKQSELPREYVQPRQVTRNVSNIDTVAAAPHGLATTHGDAIFFTNSGGTLPPPLQLSTIYYARYVDADSFSVFPTRADAIANTNQIVLAGAGAGTHTFHLAYYQGDIVWGGSLSILAATSSRLFLVVEDLPTAIPTATLPTVTDWFQMPADGVYEIYTSLGASALADLNYDQSLDVWTHCKPQSAAFTLVRETATAPSGSSTTLDYTKFVFRRVDPQPGPPAPTLTLGSQEFGEYYRFDTNSAAPLDEFPTDGATDSGLILGDIGYVESSVGSGLAVTGLDDTPGFFIITTTTNNVFKMRTITGGFEAVNQLPGTTVSASFRRVGSSSKTTDSYVVTALRDGDESLASSVLTVTNNLEVPGSSNVLTWTAVTGAQRYRLYKLIDAAYGLIIETDLLTATDDNIGPDLATQPPTFDNTLDTQYPRATANFQQRAWFGGTDSSPRTVWGSKTGTTSTMSYHVPTLLDTDRIEVKVAARERTLVRHIVSASQLWVMTSSAEIKLTGQNTDVLSPVIGIDARALSQIGCTGVRPIVANSNILFVGAKNNHIYEMPAQTLQIVDPPDLSIRAAHLFDEFTTEQSAQQEAPVPVEWYVRSDGALLGMTYMPEQNIRGWHVHEAAGTDAEIQSVCVIPDSDGQRLYAVISRTINSATVLHVERMGRISQPTELVDCRYLDSCVTYTGTATTTIPAAHLVGETVYAVADGALKGPFVVSAGGTITLGTAASTVHVGLLFTATLRSLPPAMLIEGYGKGIQTSVSEVSLRVDNSCGFSVAVYSDDGIARRSWAANGIDNLSLKSRDIPVPVEGSYGRNSQIDISQTSPFPLTIVSMTLNVTTGGP